MITTFDLWENSEKNKTKIHRYGSERKKSKACVVIFAGGAYMGRSAYEDDGYARFLNENGYDAFVVDYRVSPEHFPLPLLDARRAIRFVRANAEKFDLGKNKVLVMGSSAGGHLAALVSTCTEKIAGETEDDIDRESFLPNGQILCYPVIVSDERVSHEGSYRNLLGERYFEKEKYSPELLVNERTPQAYLWHTAEDSCVNVINSYRYAEALRKCGIPCEMHVFPHGSHGLGLATQMPYVTRWKEWLLEWLKAYD